MSKNLKGMENSENTTPDTHYVFLCDANILIEEYGVQLATYYLDNGQKVYWCLG